MEVFDCLSISAVVDGKIFCVHGGLSPDIKTIDQINTIERRMEVPTQGSFADLLWSDPDDDESFSGYWGPNERGVGCVFGRHIVDKVFHGGIKTV